ncbi:MAG: hypothetical protein E5X67_14130 [Mesorhizobium sp.]|uniref:ORC-CDC6 family AAA ATPase n=1 Tax=Mesorhizobium sp. TaxID=1871066 RepID=UPI0012040CF3|nr:hypothetical protein [Mesorhizobium sp.]TIP27752.1 MAG: hypothetical protein E5X67_14130 [Mesorhizobium sp.]
MQNPFGPNRIEYESRPVLWFSKKAATISKAAKPVFVAGTRGSGKTSILRSMSTLHILDDRKLEEQIGSLDWYGVFFQLNETFSPLIDNAVLSLVPEPIRLDPVAVKNRHFVIFSHYLELKIVERLLETLSSLRRESHLVYSATDDRNVALRINRDVLHFLKFEGKRDFFGLDELTSLVSRYIERCFNAFFMGRRETDSPFFATDPGSVLSRVVSAVSPLISGPAFAADHPIKFKIMIDDCEVLTPLQQQFLNTIVRKTRGEVKWVLAYIGGLYDTIRTVIPGQSLSNADRDVENLDSATDKEFAYLCQNVASLRLFYALPDKMREGLKINDPLTAFSLKRRLGVLSLNQIIERVIESASPESSEGRQKLIRIAEDAREFFDLNMTRSQLEQLAPNLKARPYVEGLALSQIPKEERERRGSPIDVKAFQRIIARKQSWAFLEACRILRLHEYPYVGHQIIVQLSDLCIRDFLDIMGEIYARVVGGNASHILVLDFINSDTEIPIEQQRRAVTSASEKKLQGLESLAQPFEEESVRMVRALGRLTAKLQTELDENELIGTTERGLFRINRGDVRSLATKMELPDSKIDEVLKRAEKDGFIREVSDRRKLESPYQNPDATEVTVRLHRRFAPHFRFSYRGPYETNVLPAGRVIELLLTRTQTPEDWADAVFKELFPPAEDWGRFQKSLFDDGDTDVQ